MNKIFKKLHLWLSVPAGIVIFIICFTGAMLVFEQEITMALRSEVYYTDETETGQLPIGILMEKVKSVLPDSVSPTGITVFSDPHRCCQVSISYPRMGSVFINQYTGEITGKYERLAFFRTMVDLHRWLLDDRKGSAADSLLTGKNITGIATLAFVIILITGTVIWMPRARKKIRRSLSISVHDGMRRFWTDLHVAGGMWALVLLLIMALTGLTWSYKWYRESFYRLFGAEVTTASPASGKNNLRNFDSVRDYSCWQTVYDTLKADNPTAPEIRITPTGAVVKRGNMGNTRGGDRYEFDSSTGAIVSSEPYRDQSLGSKMSGIIYSVHTGKIGGVFTKILWLICSLSGASLPLTGYYIWLRPRRKTKR